MRGVQHNGEPPTPEIPASRSPLDTCRDHECGRLSHLHIATSVTKPKAVGPEWSRCVYRAIRAALELKQQG